MSFKIDSKKKKYLIIGISIFLVVSIFTIAYLIINKTFDTRSDAQSYAIKAKFINNDSSSVTLTQLDTYKISLLNAQGKQLKGPYKSDVVYCPPGITRTSNPEKVVSTTINTHLGRCVSYQVDFAAYTTSNGTIEADLGKLAIEWRPTEIGTFYEKFFETNNPSAVSNELTLTVIKLNMLDYWSMNQKDYYVYTATNYAANRTGFVYMDYVQKDKVCSTDQDRAAAWRVFGSNKYVYWNPVYKAGVTNIDAASIKAGVTSQPASELNLYLSSTYTKTTFSGDTLEKTPLDKQYIGFNSWTNYPTDPSLYSASTDIKNINDTVYTQLANGVNVSENLKKFDNAASASRAYGNPTSTTFDVVNNLKDSNNAPLGKGTSLIYMPVLLDLNDEYNSDQTEFFTAASNDPLACSKVAKQTATGATFTTMHSISFIPFKDSKYGYGVDISLKEIYKDWFNPKCLPGTNANGTYKTTIANFKNGDCQAVLREDYYTNKGVGLTALVTDQFGKTGFHSDPSFLDCKDDPDCRSSIATGYTTNRKQVIQTPKVKVTLKTLGTKPNVASYSVLTSNKTSSLIKNASLSAFVPTPFEAVSATRTIASTNTASYTTIVNTNLLDSDMDSFQVIIDEKGGYAPICGTTNFSTASNGGVRLMFNKKTWKLGNINLNTTSSQSALYYYNPIKIAYTNGYNSSTNAANAYGWYILGTNLGTVTLTNGFVITNLKYTNTNGIWTISFDLKSPAAVNVNNLNTYFSFRKPSKPTGNSLSTVHDYNIAYCNTEIISKILYKE